MKNKILLVVCALFGLMMVNAGLNKFLQYMPLPEMSEGAMGAMLAMISVKWLMPLVAVVEIVGGVLIAIPKTRAFGALVILPVMFGIVIHLLVLDPASAAVGVVMFAINLWAIVASWPKYAPMFKA